MAITLPTTKNLNTLLLNQGSFRRFFINSPIIFACRGIGNIHVFQKRRGGVKQGLHKILESYFSMW